MNKEEENTLEVWKVSVLVLCLIAGVFLMLFSIDHYRVDGLTKLAYCGTKNIEHEFVYNASRQFAAGIPIGSRCCTEIEKDLFANDTGIWTKEISMNCIYVSHKGITREVEDFESLKNIRTSKLPRKESKK